MGILDPLSKLLAIWLEGILIIVKLLPKESMTQMLIDRKNVPTAALDRFVFA